MLAEQHPHSEPVYVVNALESAWNEHDLQALADLFDDDAVLVFEPALEQRAGEGRYEGLAAIQDLLSRYVPGGSFTTREIAVDGHAATFEFEQWSDRLRALGLAGVAGQGQVRVWNARIQELRLSLSAETAGRLQAMRGQPDR